MQRLMHAFANQNHSDQLVIIVDRVGYELVTWMLLASTAPMSTTRIPTDDPAIWQAFLTTPVVQDESLHLGQWIISDANRNGPVPPTHTVGTFAPVPPTTSDLRYLRDGVWTYTERHEVFGTTIFYTARTPDGLHQAKLAISDVGYTDDVQSDVTDHVIQEIHVQLADATLPPCAADDCRDKGRIILRARRHCILHDQELAPGDVIRLCPNCHLALMRSGKGLPGAFMFDRSIKIFMNIDSLFHRQ
jgi:hypothetical protein